MEVSAANSWELLRVGGSFGRGGAYAPPRLGRGSRSACHAEWLPLHLVLALEAFAVLAPPALALDLATFPLEFILMMIFWPPFI